MDSKNLYKILELSNNANKYDIKKAYYTLAKRYHPDKNKEVGADEKFKEISFAYEILIDDEKKKEYDSFNHENKVSFYDTFVISFANVSGNSDTLKQLINIFYTDVMDFRMDIDNFDFHKIKERVFNRFDKINIPRLIDNIAFLMSDHVLEHNPVSNILINTQKNMSSLYGTIQQLEQSADDINDYEKSEHEIPIYEIPSDRKYINIQNDNNNKLNYDLEYLHIRGIIQVKLEEVYNMKFKKIRVSRNRLDDNMTMNIDIKEFFIPLNEKHIVIQGEGDQDSNGNYGDLIIHIKLERNDDYIRFNDYDLLINKSISLYDYIYGFKLEIQHLDNDIININCKTPIYDLYHSNNKMFYIVKNKGLYKSVKNSLRGDLLVNIIIKVPENSKEILYTYFPPINNINK